MLSAGGRRKKTRQEIEVSQGFKTRTRTRASGKSYLVVMFFSVLVNLHCDNLNRLGAHLHVHIAFLQAERAHSRNKKGARRAAAQQARTNLDQGLAKELGSFGF